MKFNVTNNEAAPLNLGVNVSGLPGWKAVVQPSWPFVAAGQSAEFAVNLSASPYEERPYDAVLEVLSKDGRKTSVPISVNAGAFNPFSGFFVLAQSDRNLLLFVIGIFFLAGLFVVYRSNAEIRRIEEAERQKAYGSEKTEVIESD